VLVSRLEVADEVLHCQLGFADHGAPGALNQPFVTLFGACDSSRLRVGRRLWHAGQQGLCQGIELSEQRLLRPPKAEHILCHLDQATVTGSSSACSWCSGCGPARCSRFAGMISRGTVSVSTAVSRTAWKSSQDGRQRLIRLASRLDRYGARILARYGDRREPGRVHFPSSRGTAINTNNFLFRC
jgi:hypothetical protein